VGHVLDRAVGRQDALLILTAEQRQIDLLTLVLVGVIFDAFYPSQNRMNRRSCLSWMPLNAMLVWSRCGRVFVCATGNAAEQR